MRFILNEGCSLRGWKNIPYAVSVDYSPEVPIEISKEYCGLFSGGFDFSGGDRLRK